MTPHPAHQAASTQQVRRANARRVLDAMWTSEPSTAAELMRATGLTRATVLTICKELVHLGWLAEAGESRNGRRAGGRTTGRPPLRYAFRAEAGGLVGVDAGQHRISVVVADLRGRALSRHEQRTQDPEACDGERRRAEILETIDAALAAAAVDAAAVRAVVLGIPAPVDAEGRSPVGEEAYWHRMNPDLATLGADRGWAPLVENDANLAALAELDRVADAGEASREESFAALLSGERFGAGLVMEGQLLRQVRGRAGEMGFLHLVEGVGSSDGLGRLAHTLAERALAAGRGSGSEGALLAGRRAADVRAEHVLAAAADGEELAVEIVEQLGEQLARICTVLGGLLDLDRVVVAGAVAESLGEVVASARRRLGAHLPAPWLRIEASALGAEGVRLGAVHLAMRQVREGALAEE